MTMSTYHLKKYSSIMPHTIRHGITLVLCGLISGCAMFGDQSSDFAALKPPWSKKSAVDKPSIDGIQGPMQRMMQASLWKKKKKLNEAGEEIGALNEG